MRAVVLILCLVCQVSVASTNDIYPFSNSKQQAQYQHLLKELRCLVCQNQDLADSNAGLAKDLKREVYEKVIEGRSDSEIIQFLTDRYGDFILFKPPVKALTYLLWFGPLLFLFIGLIIFYLYWRKREDSRPC